MNILLIGNSSASRRIQEEGERLGDLVDIVSSASLNVYVSNRGLKFKIVGKQLLLRDYDLVFFYTINSKRKLDWILFAQYISKKYGTKVVYQKYASTKYKAMFTSLYDYVKQYKHGIPFPKTVVFYSKRGLRKALEHVGMPAILKIKAPGFGRQGRGVFKIESFDYLVELVLKYSSVASRFVLREFIPNEGDIRFFVVGNKVVAAMQRIPKKGEYRSNVARGAKPVPFDFNKHPELTELAIKSANLIGNDIAGVDIMLHRETKKPYVLEINSGPQFKALERVTKVNVARKIVEYFHSLES